MHTSADEATARAIVDMSRSRGRDVILSRRSAAAVFGDLALAAVPAPSHGTGQVIVPFSRLIAQPHDTTDRRIGEDVHRVR
jgi:hypothetical protein